MESVNIEKLLEKYFEATTTAAEEKQLKEYFTQGDVAPHLEQYAPMFSYFSVAKEERSTRQVSLKTRRYIYQWVSVAAVAVIALGVFFGRDYQEQKEAEFAYLETRKALTLLAANLDRGTEKVAYLNEFEEAKQKIYKNN
ncbi:hypothetical protein [Lentiprolixibacter aurantiacus]|uniref:Uncharacterized protein n=1 Tax=Lentiprolixibacter aurantiacus TaxID=2993939 RepID=A0AAE3MMK0_9FLAO|nr:hypothetical protein [Lentiprolixibacter aurantiacus]MCX2720214.1 hypothetical protein [Lentiprolixibacter aurantiacus]